MGTWTYRIAAGATDRFRFDLAATEIQGFGFDPPIAAPPGDYEIGVTTVIGVDVPQPVVVRVLQP